MELQAVVLIGNGVIDLQGLLLRFVRENVKQEALTVIGNRRLRFLVEIFRTERLQTLQLTPGLLPDESILPKYRCRTARQGNRFGHLSGEDAGNDLASLKEICCGAVIRRKNLKSHPTVGENVRLTERQECFAVPVRRRMFREISEKTADVAQHLGVSRSLLDLRFREANGKTTSAFIAETRLAEVKRRLRKTKQSIRGISRDCGFANPNHLKNIFKRHFGMSMRDYRSAQTVVS